MYPQIGTVYEMDAYTTAHMPNLREPSLGSILRLSDLLRTLHRRIHSWYECNGANVELPRFQSAYLTRVLHLVGSL